MAPRVEFNEYGDRLKEYPALHGAIPAVPTGLLSSDDAELDTDKSKVRGVVGFVFSKLIRNRA